MEVISSVSQMKKFRDNELRHLSVGFVPTMGALHKGHISLIEKSVQDNEFTIVSIFVNPKQFNEKTDFENYPTCLEKDLEMLSKVGCNLVFTPTNADIYKDSSSFNIDFMGLDKIYEGKFRPGHFQGVVDVVYRLFTIIDPDFSYFGEKDYQQLCIIKLMTQQARFKTKICPYTIIREESGLAMSSRNERLTLEERKNASLIYKTLTEIRESSTIESNPAELIELFIKKIDSNSFLRTEYAIFCEPETMKSVKTFNSNCSVIMCVAVWCGKIRLIDNIFLQF